MGAGQSCLRRPSNPTREGQFNDGGSGPQAASASASTAPCQFKSPDADSGRLFQVRQGMESTGGVSQLHLSVEMRSMLVSTSLPFAAQTTSRSSSGPQVSRVTVTVRKAHFPAYLDPDA